MRFVLPVLAAGLLASTAPAAFALEPARKAPAESVQAPAKAVSASKTGADSVRTAAPARPAATSQAIAASAQTLAPAKTIAPAKTAADSLAAAARRAHADSVQAAALAKAAAAKAHADSVKAAAKAKADSAHAAAQARRDSVKAAQRHRADSLQAVAKARTDSAKAAKAARDSLAALAKAEAKAKADSSAAADRAKALAKAEAAKRTAQAHADSVKAARAAKAHADSVAAAVRRTRADSVRAAAKARTDSIRAAAQARQDSLRAAARHRADSLKAASEARAEAARAAARARADSIAAAKAARDSAAAAELAARHAKDSTVAKRYRILDRPLNQEEIRYFLARFRMKEVGKPESTSVNWIYRGKGGASLAYEPGVSEMAFADDSVPLLGTKDILPDSLIRYKTDAILREIMQDKAGRYAFANYEITLVQKKGADAKAKVLPPTPAFYTGRYIRRLDNRLVLGDAFQIRATYGGGGAVQSFSLRDPVLAEAGTMRIPSRDFISDSLARWAKSRTHTRNPIYPYHADHLRIREIKPVKVLETYVVAAEKFRDTPQLDGNYLVPAVTVLAEVKLSAPQAKASQPLPQGPILLHFHFPCRPDAGLCWPDGGRNLEGELAGPR